MVAIFTREITDELTSLVKKIDKLVLKNRKKQMKAFVILLTEDPDADEAKLKKLAEKHGIKFVPLTLFDGLAGPPNYRISKDAETTVMLWRDVKIKANFAFEKGKLDKKAIAKIVKDTEIILN